MMKTETPLNEENKRMRLWTWQGKDILLTEGRLDYKQSEWYQNDVDFPNIKSAYKRLFKILDTDQIHWCYADAEEAGEAAKLWKNRKKWEIEVPESDVRVVCASVWCKIIGDSIFGPSPKLWCEWKREANKEARTSRKPSRAILDRKLVVFRALEPWEDLWKKLFHRLDQIPYDAHAIVEHPGDSSLRTRMATPVSRWPWTGGQCWC
jgi:hypothetical protein